MAKSIVEIKESTIPNAGLGVFALRNIKKGECLAEYKGRFLTVEEYKKKKSYRDYIWELDDGKGNVIGYIDGGNKKYSNWTRYVNCPCVKKQENVEPVQEGYKMYYYALKNIKKGQELMIYYGSSYYQQLTGKKHLR